MSHQFNFSARGKEGFSELNKEELHLDIESDNSAAKGETALWRAVITQALMDAGSNSKKKEMKYEQSRAISWLSGISPDFIQVCFLAGLDPSYVKDKSREAIRRGCKWRKEVRNKNRSHNKPILVSKIEIEARPKDPFIILKFAS